MGGDLDPQLAGGVAVGRAGHPAVKRGEGDGSTAPGQANALGDLGHGADVGEHVVLAGDEKNALLVAGVDREGHGHAGKDNGVVEGDEEKVFHEALRVSR
jgi:hypothetical protein